MKSTTVQSLTRWSIGFLAISLLILMGCTKDEVTTTTAIVPDAAFFQTMEDAGICISCAQHAFPHTHTSRESFLPVRPKPEAILHITNRPLGTMLST